jgi:predicted site-specific integrase-resolvase
VSSYEKIYRQQLAESLRISPKTLERMIAAGKVPSQTARYKGALLVYDPGAKKL